MTLLDRTFFVVHYNAINQLQMRLKLFKKRVTDSKFKNKFHFMLYRTIHENKT